MKIEDTARGLIINPHNHFVLVRQVDRDSFLLPGGKMEPHDANVQAAFRREVKEEVSIDDLEVVGMFPDDDVVPLSAARRAEKKVDARRFSYVLARTTQEIGALQQGEIAEAQWADYYTALDLILVPSMRQRLEMWYRQHPLAFQYATAPDALRAP